MIEIDEARLDRLFGPSDPRQMDKSVRTPRLAYKPALGRAASTITIEVDADHLAEIQVVDPDSLQPSDELPVEYDEEGYPHDDSLSTR